MICFPVWENHHLRFQNRIRCSCSAIFLAVKSSYACRWTLCLCYSNSSPGCLKLAMLGNFLWTLWICPCFSMQNLQFYISADAKQVDHYQVDAKKIPTQHAPRWSSHFSASTWASSWRDQAGTLWGTCGAPVDPERKVLEDMAISREQPEPLFSPFFGGSIPDFKHYPLVMSK